MKDKQSRRVIEKLAEAIGVSVAWENNVYRARLVKFTVNTAFPKDLPAERLSRLEEQLKELYDYLGVERVTTPQETKLVKKKGKKK